MDSHDFELRLTHLKADVLSGEIRFVDLAGIAAALQELNTRITRLVSGQDGPGRTAETAARVAQLRLTGIGHGSTRLHVGYGEANVLNDPAFSSMEDEAADKFWQIVAGIQAGVRPDWTTPPVANSALDVLSAFAKTSGGAVLTRADDRQIRFETFSVAKEPWQEIANQLGDEVTTVAGTLYNVDIEARRFRIRDDVGNSIPLEDVQNPDVASELLGKRTVAVGLPLHGQTTGGNMTTRALTAVTVSRAEVPSAWLPDDADLATVLAQAALGQGPDPEGIRGITDSDVDDFLALING